jgi:outer membrane protein OmpA-like peptidoglycan-associated protein
MISNQRKEKWVKSEEKLLALLLLTLVGWLPTAPLLAQGVTPARLRIVVNSNQDSVQADSALTLREAIELVNGTLSVDRLSEAEKSQVSTATGATSEIAFQLLAGQTVIRVSQLLPDLTVPVVIDGTTQTGYAANTRAIAELPLVAPIVELTATPGAFVSRGLSIVSDNVTIRGLSIYGFTDDHDDTERTPPADIFVAHRLSPPDVSKQKVPANFAPFYSDDIPPKNVLIENNWLGIRPDQSVPPTTSAFGVSVFNSTGTTIRRNWIANHDGSAVITSVRADNLVVTENAIVGNGIAGMPDGIRLEGNINNAQITGNLICGNDGAGVYLFKPQGAAQIRDNQITYNGRRYRRAAVYLMGNDHQVTGNTIAHQAGPGVVVASFPRSSRNLIESNRFSTLEGLSIDLVTQDNVNVHDYQRGDGINPKRNSPNRRKDTGNAAINAPEFNAREFILTGIQAEVTGKADPGSQVQIYRVDEGRSAYGPLGEPLGSTPANSQGQFTLTAGAFKPGDQVTAIATDPKYGTSEPALNALIRTAESSAPAIPTSPLNAVPRGRDFGYTLRTEYPTIQTPPLKAVPRCTTPPIAEKPSIPAVPQTTPIVLKVPKNVHFALDKDFISSTSAKVLDRIAQVLLENPNIIVELQGHTDPRASDAYNLDLGKRRAISTRNYLIHKGIDPARMTLRSFGEQQPISAGDSRLDFARDRRVELIYKDARNIEVIVQEEDLQLEPAGGVR